MKMMRGDDENIDVGTYIICKTTTTTTTTYPREDKR